MANLNWPSQVDLEQGANPCMKIDGSLQARPAEEESVVPRVIQVGTIGEFLSWLAPQTLAQGSKEELTQCWESQWQEVLKAVQPHTSGQEIPQESKTSAWDDTKVTSEAICDAGRCPRGEGHTKLLLDYKRDGSQALQNGKNRTEKEETMRKGALNAEMKRQHFRQLRYQEAEGPRKVCSQLYELCLQWLRPERHTKEQILELVILEQFLAVLPQDIQSWLRGCYPQACSHAVALAEVFLRGQQQGTKVQTPDEDVIMVSSDTEEPLLGPALGYFCSKTQLKDGQDSSLTGKDRCPHVYPISSGEGALNGNNLGPSKQGDSELPMPIGIFSGQSRVPEDSCAPQQEHWAQPPLTWEEVTHCSNSVYNSVHVEEHKHWCLECGETFQASSELAQHQQTHPGPKRIECPKCGKSFRDLSHVLRHQTVHTGEKPYSCLECGQCFTQKPALIRHHQKHLEDDHYTGLGSNALRQTSHAGKRPQCQECGKSFRDISDVVRHQTVHTGKKPYRCSVCGQGFTQKTALSRHQQKHLESKPSTAGNGEHHGNGENACFNLVECAQSLFGMSHENTSTTLMNGNTVEHQLMKKPHTDNSPTVGGPKPLKKNASRRGQKNYWCITCGKGFRDKADIVRHHRSHTGEKPFECLDCGKRFTTTSSLYKHQQIHTRPDPPDSRLIHLLNQPSKSPEGDGLVWSGRTRGKSRRESQVSEKGHLENLELSAGSIGES